MKTVQTVLAASLAWIGIGFPSPARAGVTIRVHDHDIEFLAGSQLVTRYHTDPSYAKPFFWPVLGPGGLPLTRAWPMERSGARSKDHPHQKSFWFCHGDVHPDWLDGSRGIDFWSEESGHGRIVCSRIGQPRAAENSARITTQNDWLSADGRKVLDETRTISLYDLGNARLLVMDSDLRAGNAGVTFGDTKEGSFGVRINDALRTEGGNGTIENAEGQTGEKYCWGRISAWCDYSGSLDGHKVGLAMFADPSNEYPSCWHVRGYGLLAANPFGRGKSGFPAMKGRTDLVHLAKGEQLHLRYGVLLHEGDAHEGRVAEQYRRFVQISRTRAGHALRLLWPNGAPGALGEEERDKPAVTVQLPPRDKANGTAVVVCPGGGYGGLAFDYEGTDVASWLNARGVAGFVLRYRLGPRYHHPAPLQDAQRAIRLVRSHAKEWGLDPHRIGIWGFSAGGHLASTAATHFDAGDPNSADPIERVSCRPDFCILAYPVITMDARHTHMGSRINLLGRNPSQKLVDSLSNETQVSTQTPPTFLMHTSTDSVVPAENSVMFYLALLKARVPAELHIFQKGPHGVGLGQRFADLKIWPQLLETWMRENRFIRRND